MKINRCYEERYFIVKTLLCARPTIQHNFSTIHNGTLKKGYSRFAYGLRSLTDTRTKTRMCAAGETMPVKSISSVSFPSQVLLSVNYLK